MAGRTSASPRRRRRAGRLVAAGAVAAFLGVWGLEAARLQASRDPVLTAQRASVQHAQGRATGPGSATGAGEPTASVAAPAVASDLPMTRSS